EPVVRFIWGEEPKVQLPKMGRSILVPVVAVALFLMAWALIAGQIHTKSGKLPGPIDTYTQATHIWQTHVRETEKKHAYHMTGDARIQKLAAVESRLAELNTRNITARSTVANTQAQTQTLLDKATTPLYTQLDQLKTKIKTTEADHENNFKTQANQLIAGDQVAHRLYLKTFTAPNKTLQAQHARRHNLKSQVRTFENAELSPSARDAQTTATALAQERLHLMALQDLLSKRNRETKLAHLKTELETQTTTFYAATGENAYLTARQIKKTRRQINRTTTANYPMPYTLPWQVVRSVMCVFAGFVIGTLIAVPVGVLCGLSPTVMAGMTPFIALLKPVSPIVWLPIMLIIVSGLTGDPATNPIIQLLWSMPGIGGFEINPAFLASAAVVALCSLWATLANTALGVASIDQDHLNVARVLKLGFGSRLFKIVLPSALPLMFAGMRISLGVGWMVLIAAELLASSEGIGKYVIDQFNNGSAESFASLFVVVFVVGIIGLLLDRIMIVFQRMVSFDGSVASI
ncbi:MAG: ABC transporter permease subunit, partial [Algisphaera sp.]